MKADLHTHSADDPRDDLKYSSEMLIDAVARKGVEVLAIACHDGLAHTRRLAEYARARGVLLIPAIERIIEGKHVLIIAPEPGHLTAASFEELRTMERGNALFVAPHPFYFPARTCLHGHLKRHADLFSAVEHSCLYSRLINPNRKAARVARELGLPMIANSDTHALPYLDTNLSWIEAEPTVEGVIDAIRAGRVKVDSRPWPLRDTLRLGLYYSLQVYLELVWMPIRDLCRMTARTLGRLRT
jgi:predicted metal-dependent phosphoesterase TrpH